MSDTKPKRRRWKETQRLLCRKIARAVLGNEAGGSKKRALEVAQSRMLASGELEPHLERPMLTGDVKLFMTYLKSLEGQPLDDETAGDSRDSLNASVTGSHGTDPELPMPHFDPAVVRAGMLIDNLRVLAHEILIKPLGAEIEAAMSRAFAKMAPTPPPQPQPAPPPPPVVEESRLPAAAQKPKVLVISNMDRNLDVLRREFPNIDIRFVHCNSVKQIEQISPNMDVTFVMTKFVNHGAQKVARGNVVLIPPSAGQSMLAREIAKRFPAQFRRANGNGQHPAHQEH